MNTQRIARILVGISMVLLPMGVAQAKTVAKTPVKAVVAKKAAPVKKAPAKKVVAKKPVKKAVVKKTNAATCVKCKSVAEGADKSAAARATSWSGTVIGINDGEHSYVVTEGTKLDHIKAFAQRSVRVTSGTELVHNGQVFDFSQLDVGARVTVWGEYNSAKRIITATRVEAKSGVRAEPLAFAPTAQAAFSE